MDIGKFEKRMDDALGELKHLLVQSGYYDNQTLENIDCDRDDPGDVQRWNELTSTSKLLLKAIALQSVYYDLYQGFLIYSLSHFLSLRV